MDTARKVRLILTITGVVALCSLAACGGGRRGGGSRPRPPIGGGGGGGAPSTVTLEDLRGAQRVLATALGGSYDPAARWALRRARGERPSLAELPVGYWDADLAARPAMEGDPDRFRWFRSWIFMRTHPEFCGPRNKDWMCAPSGSQNHGWAQVGGEYWSFVVLGEAEWRKAGGKGDPVAAMRAFLEGVWPCCGPGHYQWAGEIVGSRHYSVRTWSDMWAFADLCPDPTMRARAREILTRAWTTVRAGVRTDGVWPEDKLPLVRAERDDLCFWPDPAIRAKYGFLTKHPSFTPHTSFVLFDLVDFDPAAPGRQPNRDFIGHKKDPTCDNCKDGCDESSEANNIGLLICGAGADGKPGWLPPRSR